MTTRAELLKAATALGVTVEIRDSRSLPWMEVLLEAPKGHTMDGDVHEFVTAGYRGQPIQELYRDALERLQQATIEPCARIPSCDWCNPGH